MVRKSEATGEEGRKPENQSGLKTAFDSLSSAFKHWLGQQISVEDASGLPVSVEGRYLKACFIVFRVHDHYELIHIEENRDQQPVADEGLNGDTVELFSELLNLESDWISQQQNRENPGSK